MVIVKEYLMSTGNKLSGSLSIATNNLFYNKKGKVNKLVKE
jgi:hypothetical protein